MRTDVLNACYDKNGVATHASTTKLLDKSLSSPPRCPVRGNVDPGGAQCHRRGCCGGNFYVGWEVWCNIRVKVYSLQLNGFLNVFTWD